MSYILGIDTGGTFTDGVVFDIDERQVVARAKALTNYENLVVGIRRCIENLGSIDLGKIHAVSLSTTLATNAIVEGRGCQVGLILIGQQSLDALPASLVEVIGGGHDVKGNELEKLDLAAAEAAVERLRGKVSGVAISSYFSVRNPEHEMLVSAIIAERLGVPVVCAHQLTTSLGFRERTVTAVLNAKLIPIIADLIESVKSVMAAMGLDRPLMIVKGDGTLMTEEMARQKPIDTILSGPAASIIGSLELADRTEAVVVDMGGTTTDIAILQQGVPRLSPEGAVVNNWLTRVEAARVYTYGLGGDSYIRLGPAGEIILGPEKVWPLSLVCGQYPYLLREIREQGDTRHPRANFQPCDCYMMLKKPVVEDWNPSEEGALALLADGPHSLEYLSERLQEKGLLNLQRLVEAGVVARVALTPTDILHVKGTFTPWNVEAAYLGSRIMARYLGVTAEEFATMAFDAVVDRLCRVILESLFCDEDAPVKAGEDKDYFLDKLLNPAAGEILGIEARLKYPVIAVGAPVQAYLPPVVAKLRAELLIPADAAVANAVGAAAGKVIQRVKIILKPAAEGQGVIMHAPWERRLFSDLREAKQYAIAAGRGRVGAIISRSGLANYQFLENCDDKYVRPNDYGQDKVFLETRIEIIGLGCPKW